MPSRLPRTYLVAGTLEPFFFDNAARWAAALRDASADVVMSEKAAGHHDEMWRREFPLMIAWPGAGVRGDQRPDERDIVSRNRPAHDTSNCVTFVVSVAVLWFFCGAWLILLAGLNGGDLNTYTGEVSCTLAGRTRIQPEMEPE